MSTVSLFLTISVDGFVTGENQTLERPFGDGDAGDLHRWMREDAASNAAEIAEIIAPSAFIMGRNMFTPGRGDWDLEWQGWWGETPPYGGPVFVLTHYPREPLVLDGTTFTFVTTGPESALELALAAGDGETVSIAGGADVARQYLAAGLVDELHLNISPLVLGAGERLWDGLGGLQLTPLRARHTRYATHVSYRVGS